MNIKQLVIIYNILVINIKAKCELLNSWNHTHKMPSQLRVLKWKPIKLITQFAMQHKECVLKNFKINQQQMYVLWNKKK